MLRNQPQIFQLSGLGDLFLHYRLFLVIIDYPSKFVRVCTYKALRLPYLSTFALHQARGVVGGLALLSDAITRAAIACSYVKI